MKGNYPNIIKCPTCQENPPAFSSSCDIYKREREIVEIYITIFEARRTVEFYMGDEHLRHCCMEDEPNQKQQSTRQLQSSSQKNNPFGTK